MSSGQLHVHVSPLGQGGLPQRNELQEAMDDIARRLNPKLRNIFLTRARALVSQSDSNLVGAAPAIPIANLSSVVVMLLPCKS